MAQFTQSDRYRLVARVVVSLVCLCAALWVILSGVYPDATLKWAFGIVGLIIGYWLR